MERRLEVELRELKSQLLAMGSHVEQSIETATSALQQRSSVKLEEVFSLEAKINSAHMEIDNACLGILARQSPVAANLRLILAVIKINTDLERMGDQSVNIAQNASHYLGDQIVDASLNLPKMASLVRAMVRDSLDAFMKSDSDLATEVLKRDDAVDDLRDLVFEKLVPYMKNHPDRVEAALDLILISRNLERLADHATNIAEDVIFACTGADVRHKENKQETSE
jgi:phosphate transport system protein